MGTVASANLNITFSFSLASTNPAGQTTFGPGSEAFSLANLAAIYDSLFYGKFWIPAKFTFTGTPTSSSPTLSSVSSFAGLAVGQLLTGVDIPVGTVIQSLNPGASTVTMSKNATASPGAESIVAQTVPTAPTAVLATGGSLTLATTYFYKITATGPQGDISSSQAAATVETMPSVEVSATPTGVSQTINLSWTQVQGATGYNIYRGTVTNTENLLVGTITSGSLTTFSDIGYAGSSLSPPASPPPNFVEFAVNTWTDLVGVTNVIVEALSLMVNVVGPGSAMEFAPGNSNPLTWFFSGTTPAINWTGTGVFSYSLAPTGPGGTVSGSVKTFRLTNNGGLPAMTDVVLLGGST